MGNIPYMWQDHDMHIAYFVIKDASFKKIVNDFVYCQRVEDFFKLFFNNQTSLNFRRRLKKTQQFEEFTFSYDHKVPVQTCK
jgi:hypothetical protein